MTPSSPSSPDGKRGRGSRVGVLVAGTALLVSAGTWKILNREGRVPDAAPRRTLQASPDRAGSPGGQFPQTSVPESVSSRVRPREESPLGIVLRGVADQNDPRGTYERLAALLRVPATTRD